MKMIRKMNVLHTKNLMMTVMMMKVKIKVLISNKIMNQHILTVPSKMKSRYRCQTLIQEA